MARKEIKIHVQEHRPTGLLTATSDDLPGFVVHAHAEKELLDKLGNAFEQFMAAIGTPVSQVEVTEYGTPPGFWPPAYIAKATLAQAA